MPELSKIEEISFRFPADKPIRWIPGKLVKAMLGGKWPEHHGFCFDAVAVWKVERGGRLVPYDGENGSPCPGPDFVITCDHDSFPL
jgi:hypothetical protein